MKKTIIRIVCFFLVLTTVMLGVNKIFKVKYADGIYSMTKYYELDKNTVDVILLGSSHCFENFNTGTLWDEFGMASYLLCGSFQPLWNTYYYLKEGLKTQTPKVIVLEGYMTKMEEDYMDDSRIIKNNYGMKMSLNKIKAIAESTPRENWPEFMLEYEQYHNRYKELSASDFMKNQHYTLYDDWKGLGLNMATTPLETIDVKGIEERQELNAKTEKYYRMIIELAQSKNIPIVVAISPYAGITEERMKQFNRASDIAAEYGVPFINFNTELDEIGIDFSKDAADPAHLNYKGNTKFSAYFGKWLKSEYDIPDRRGQKEYESWQKNADYIREMIYNQQLTESHNLESMALKLCNEAYWVVVSVNDDCDIENEVIKTFLTDLGIDAINPNGIWLRQNNGLVWSSGKEESILYLKSRYHDFALKRIPDESGYENVVIMDKERMEMQDMGITVFVFDSYTELAVDMFGIDENGNVIR